MIVRRDGVRVAAVLAAVVLALLSVRSMAIDYFESAAPGALVRFFPDTTPGIIARTSTEGLLRGPVYQRDEGVWALREALRQEPLSSTPLVLLGMVRARSGDFTGGDQLVQRGLGIDPRDRDGHLWLLYRGLSTANHVRAAIEAIRLMELLPERNEALAGIVIQQAADPAARRAIRQAGMSPLSRATIMEAALKSKLPTAALVEMVPDSELAPGAAQANGIRPLRLRMEQDQDYAGLLRLWQRTLPSPAPEPPDSLYDGSFRGLPGGPPFNWTLSGNSNGSAERADLAGAPAPTGLVVTQSGFNGGTYAEQLMLLRPGAYRLELDALSETDDGGASQPIHVLILCAVTGAALGDLAVPPRSAWQRVAYRFIVPAGQCAAQKIRIAGRPQNDSENGRLSLTRMAVVRDGQ